MRIIDVAQKVSEANPELNKHLVYKTLIEIGKLSLTDLAYINSIHKHVLAKRRGVLARETRCKKKSSV